MSEGGEKTELPTPKKERDAREQGQVARSQEVVSAFSLFAVIAYLWAAWGPIKNRLTSLFDVLAALENGDFRTNVHAGMTVVSTEVVGIMLPVLAITVLAGVAANVAQFGFLFSFKSIMPSLDKISPASGFKKIFALKALVEIFKSILKITILTILLYVLIKGAIGSFANSVNCGLSCQAALTADMLLKVLIFSAFAFVVVAVADFWYQKHTHTKGLMMSKDEVKREFKESEGDPHIKGKRKQLAQELAMGDGGQAARKGTAVVVNPTHFAVVLHYEAGKTPLPLVTAKGRNIHAAFLRTEAERAGVPVFRNVSLARALYADTSVNSFVPDELFEAVAEVLSWVARNQHLLYKERLSHGVIDMDAGDHRAAASAPA